MNDFSEPLWPSIRRSIERLDVMVGERKHREWCDRAKPIITHPDTLDELEQVERARVADYIAAREYEDDMERECDARKAR